MKICLARSVGSFWLRRQPYAVLEHRQFGALVKNYATLSTQQGQLPFNTREYRIFARSKTLKRSPKGGASEWTALLDPALPIHMRQVIETPSGISLDGEDIAEILLAAQRPDSTDTGFDLLYHMGMQQGRWQAVVWLVKHLVENLALSRIRPHRLSQLVWPWKDGYPLEELTENTIELTRPVFANVDTSDMVQLTLSLDELTDATKPDTLDRVGMLQRNVLGRIWRSLGVMIIACHDSVVKPEILEIIAYMHHQGAMPATIYQCRPGTDETAIQQPPTLHLLSSRILTSLSDASWRAHEKTIVEEAKAKGGEYISLRPEIPGTAYRVTVAGLKAEIWLELVLWSCLHGGWILEGASILRTLYLEPKERQWKPLSWRSLGFGQSELFRNWDKVNYIFKTRPSSSMASSDDIYVDVRRTVSSEVVNAYIDALLSTMDIGVGDRGAPPLFVLNQLNMLRSFLERSGLRLDSGSWDAIVLRFVESQNSEALTPTSLQQLLSLSPGFGDEVDSGSMKQLPPHIRDASAAMLGLHHRALLLQIKAGDFEGALHVFRGLQNYTDDNKRRSIVDFFKTVRHRRDHSTAQASGIFTDNFVSKIDYPSFDLQIPPSTLGQLLDLTVDTKAYEFGSWMLFNDEIDGPLIPERLYVEPTILPALVKFAAVTKNRALLERLLRSNAACNSESGGPSLDRNVLTSFLDVQVGLMQWDPAERILEYMRDTLYSYWNIVNLATVARVMVLQSQAPIEDTRAQEHASHAKSIFANMVGGRYSRSREVPQYLMQQTDTILVLLSAASPPWAAFCATLRPFNTHVDVQLPTKALNILFDAFVEAHGVRTARRVLAIFWSPSVRYAQKRSSVDRAKLTRMPQFRPHVLNAPERRRKWVHLKKHSQKSVVTYGGLQPDVMTILIILRGALKRLNDTGGLTTAFPEDMLSRTDGSRGLFHDDTSASHGLPGNRMDLSFSGTVIWAVRSLRALGMTDRDIKMELINSLEESQMQGLWEKLSKLLEDLGLEANE